MIYTWMTVGDKLYRLSSCTGRAMSPLRGEMRGMVYEWEQVTEKKKVVRDTCRMARPVFFFGLCTCFLFCRAGGPSRRHFHLAFLCGETPLFDNEKDCTCFVTEYRYRCILSYVRLSGFGHTWHFNA